VGGIIYLFSASETNDFDDLRLFLITERGEPGDPKEPLEFGLRFIYFDRRSADEIPGDEGFVSTAHSFFHLLENLPLSFEIYDRLRDYLDIVPDSQADFDQHPNKKSAEN